LSAPDLASTKVPAGPMASKKKVLLSILVPSYNEERYVSSVIAAIHTVKFPDTIDYEILLIDDGSQDKTLDHLRSFETHAHISVFHIPANCGKGAAVRIGIKKAKGDIILIQDADMEYDPHDYPKLLQPILNGQTLVVYGSRFLKHKWGPVGGMRLSNWLGNKLICFCVFLLYGRWITDEATAYKVYQADFLRSLTLRANGFEICPEMTAKALLRGQSIIEIPIQYRARGVDQGKKIRWTDGLKAIMMLLKCRFSQI